MLLMLIVLLLLPSLLFSVTNAPVLVCAGTVPRTHASVAVTAAAAAAPRQSPMHPQMKADERR